MRLGCGKPDPVAAAALLVDAAVSSIGIYHERRQQRKACLKSSKDFRTGLLTSSTFSVVYWSGSVSGGPLIMAPEAEIKRRVVCLNLLSANRTDTQGNKDTGSTYRIT